MPTIPDDWNGPLVLGDGSCPAEFPTVGIDVHEGLVPGRSAAKGHDDRGPASPDGDQPQDVPSSAPTPAPRSGIADAARDGADADAHDDAHDDADDGAEADAEAEADADADVLRTHVPFGPFLGVAALEYVLLSDRIDALLQALLT